MNRISEIHRVLIQFGYFKGPDRTCRQQMTKTQTRNLKLMFRLGLAGTSTLHLELPVNTLWKNACTFHSMLCTYCAALCFDACVCVCGCSRRSNYLDLHLLRLLYFIPFLQTNCLLNAGRATHVYWYRISVGLTSDQTGGIAALSVAYVVSITDTFNQYIQVLYSYAWRSIVNNHED